VKSSVSPWWGKALNLGSRFRFKEQKNKLVCRQNKSGASVRKTTVFVLTLRQTHPTGYKQRKVILPESCLVRIAHQTTKIDMILKIKNHKSKITYGITSR
jgi:hypothetical protein